jgi:hypothetical protein
MGTVTLRDTVEKVGDASISTVEYIFSDAKDFFQWETYKRDAMNEAVKSFVDGQLFGGYGEEPVGEDVDAATSAVVDINVKKKDNLH